MTEQVDAPIDPQMSAQAAEAVIADAALNAQNEGHDVTGKRKREDGEEEAPPTTRAQFKRQGIPQQPPTGAFMPVNNVGVAPTAQMQSANQFAQMQQNQNGVDALSMHPGIPIGVGQQVVFDNMGRQQPGNDQIDPAFNLQAHNPQPQQVQQQAPQQVPAQSPQPAPKPPVGSEEWHRVRRDNHKEVERRRRETINEGINELAKIVPNCEKNKGSILQRAVQYITQLKEAEATNIEKWTLEKLLTEQAIAELHASNEKLKAECERAWREAETWKKSCLSAGVSRPAEHSTPGTSGPNGNNPNDNSQLQGQVQQAQNQQNQNQNQNNQVVGGDNTSVSSTS